MRLLCPFEDDHPEKTWKREWLEREVIGEWRLQNGIITGDFDDSLSPHD